VAVPLIIKNEAKFSVPEWKVTCSDGNLVDRERINIDDLIL